MTLFFNGKEVMDFRINGSKIYSLKKITTTEFVVLALGIIKKYKFEGVTKRKVISDKENGLIRVGKSVYRYEDDKLIIRSGMDVTDMINILIELLGDHISKIDRSKINIELNYMEHDVRMYN